jgi:phage/plasmid-like protein (TIGR03299 family)
MRKNLKVHDYDNAAPWDGIGADIKPNATTKQLLRAAGLDWTITKRPLAAIGDDGDYTPLTSHFALERSDNGAHLDVVGSRYIPANNEPLFDFLKDFCDEGKAKISQAGSLRDGRVVWALADLGVDFTLPGRDRVGGYLFVGIPHMRGRSVVARVTTVRDVCHNTMAVTMRSGKHGLGNTFRMNHRNTFDEAQIDYAKETLGLARDNIVEFAKTAQKLHKMKVTPAKAKHVLTSIFQPDWDGKDDGLSSRVQQLLDINERAPGAQPGTAWGVLNAVTYYADHVASRSADKRLSNAWLGRTAKQKQATLDLLLA